MQKSHTPISRSGQGNPGTSSRAGKQKETKRRFYDLSQAVKELRTVNQVLSQPDSRMQENEAFGSYVALALDKLPQREAIMAQNEIQNKEKFVESSTGPIYWAQFTKPSYSTSVNQA
jgi:hypothetical protein